MQLVDLLSSTKKLLIAVIVLNILAITGYYFMFDGLKQKNEDASVLIKNLDIKAQEEGDLKFIDENLKSTELERGQLNSYFVQGDEIGVASFIEEIEGVGDFTNTMVDVNSILIKDIDGTNGVVQDMKLSLAVEGKWQNVLYTIEMLESMPYKISFDRIFIEKDGNELEPTDIWSGILNINILKLGNNN